MSLKHEMTLEQRFYSSIKNKLFREVDHPVCTIRTSLTSGVTITSRTEREKW